MDKNVPLAVMKGIVSKTKGLLMLSTLLLVSLLSFAQTSQVYNDAVTPGAPGVRLRVWLHAVYSDANCSENQLDLAGKETKFVFRDLRIRASNGTNFQLDNFPQQNLIVNPWAQTMTFRVKGKTNRFWLTNDAQFRMMNPYYPFRGSTVNLFNDNYIPTSQSDAAPFALGSGSPVPRPIGLDGSAATQGFLMFDRTFSGNKAPDRYQWQLQEAFESDADLSGSEAGNLICGRTFGLPHIYEGNKPTGYDPVTNILILDSVGISIITWALAQGICTNILGFEIDPLALDQNIILNIVNGIFGGIFEDFDDSRAVKNNWDADPSFFRGTPPGEVGYFATEKLRATNNADNSSEGYMLVFAHRWDWVNPSSPVPSAPSEPRVQLPLCPSEVYTDAAAGKPIQVQAWLDGLFNDKNHEGLDLGGFLGDLLDCTDVSVTIGESQQLLGREEIRVRARAKDQFDGAMPAWNASALRTQDNPEWWPVSNYQILNRSYTTQTGMSNFQFDVEAWESDCNSATPTSCDVCLLSFYSGQCCILELFGSCIIPGISVNGNDNSSLVSASGSINWRNSPPDTDNYYYTRMRLSGSQHQSWIARIRYRWTIPQPVINSVDGSRDVVLCPGETHTMTADADNATWYQWQYAEVETPAGPACPTNATWVDVTGANCPTYTTPVFTGTRIYRLKVMNRNGDGSKTPNGNKFAEAFSVCTRITILNNIDVPIQSPLACGTSGVRTPVRAGTTYTFQPVLPPDSGSVDIPGAPPVRYTWTATGGAVVGTPAPGASPWSTTITFPSTAGAAVNVTMTTVLTDRCPTATNGSVTCYFITEDPGCSAVTGVVYATPTAAAGGVGSINRPYRLADAFAAAASDPGIKHIKLLEGNYTINTIPGNTAMLLTNNLVVEGGYVQEFDPIEGVDIWVKRSDAITNITSGLVEQIDADRIHRIGFRATGNNWVLQDLNITTTAAPARNVATYGKGRGLSNYAIHINNSTGWRILNVTTTAGNAGPGSQGDTQAEDCPFAPIAAGASGSGTTGGNNNICGSRAGGTGGDAGQPGFGATQGPPTFGLGGTYPSGNGTTGRIGTIGNPDANFTFPADLALLNAMSYFTPKGQNPANNGQDGSGGGGGAGSATGGGGAGGVGGKGGTPGWGGGGAFNLWVSGTSSGSVRASDFGTSVGNAGLGGPGGFGQTGYIGGTGAAGAGAGGAGGNGGLGGPGAPGVSFATFFGPSATVSVDAPDGENPADSIKSNYASGCTNSFIEIRKKGGLWGGLPSIGAFDYPDINPIPLSSTASNAPDNKFIYFQTGNLGPKNLETNPGGTYYNQLYIRYDRQAPVITLPSIICSGTPVDFLSDPNSADPLEYEWVVQEIIAGVRPLGIYTSPAPAISILTTEDAFGVQLPINTSGAPKVYQVRYRVKDNCCGWSIPVYRDITVLSDVVNLLSQPDTSFICSAGDPAAITTRPGFPLTADANRTFQWYQSFNGGAYTPIAAPAGTAENYNPPVLGTPGTYRFLRIIGSTLASCSDTSNIVTIIVQENFSANVIDPPLPYTATCVSGTAPAQASGSVTTLNANFGSMSGSVPIGPGGNPANYTYQWQHAFKPRDSSLIVPPPANYPLTWQTPTPANFPSESGSPQSQNWDPGTGNVPALGSFGTSTNIFQQGPANAGKPGYIYFRRIVRLAADPTRCVDTSNVISAEVFPGAANWNSCPTYPSAAACDAFGTPQTAIYGYQGTCALIAPDTVCSGTVVTLSINPRVNGILATGLQYAWYRQSGGPFNSTLSSPTRCNVLTSCTSPMLATGCSNNKPAKADFLSFSPYNDTANGEIQVLIDSTTTYYVNVTDRCFDTATFRTTANPLAYPNTQIGQRWQRRTVIVVTPILPLSSLTASDTALCGTTPPPANITLTINGGRLGNDGQYELFRGDPNAGGVLIATAVKRDSSFTGTGRVHVVPRPTTTTTYYARIVNRCDTTPTVQVTVVVDTPSVSATSFTAPSPICPGSTITLTRNGGSLGNKAQWVLYANSITPVNKLDSNLTGNFTVTPATTTTYILRAESRSSCPQVDPDSVEVVVTTALTAPTALTALPTVVCESDTVRLTVSGGSLGSSGKWFLYRNSVASAPIDSNTTGVFYGVLVNAPTTFFVRAASNCDTTAAVSTNVTVADSSTSPTGLSGEALICAGTSTTLTTTGGSLGTNGRWYLYNGNPTSGGVLMADNLTGIFNVTVNATTTYFVRAQDAAPCNRATNTASFTVAVDDSCVCASNPGFVEYAPTATITLATVECLDTSGWTYYSTVAQPDVYLFAIEKKPAIGSVFFPNANTNDFTAEVEITVNNAPTSPLSVMYAEDILNCDATFVMPRWWNVHVTSGSLNGFVRTRFFYPPAELAAVFTRASTWLAGQGANPACAGSTVGPAQVFKTTDATDFEPLGYPNGGLVGGASDIEPTTINNRVYVGHLLNSLPSEGTNTIQGKNYIQVAWAGFSGGGISVRVSADTAVLPVTLLYFTGSLVEDKVILDWETASELNNDYFVVEKSNDGRSWSSIGRVKGNGTTSKPHKYSLVDPSPFLGDNYYRLRQVDYDGTYDYSRIIVINVGTEAAKSGFLGVYPNPTSGAVRATISSVTDQDVFIKVMDVTGRYMTSKNVALGKGINNVDMDFTRFPGGAYIISFTDSQGEEHNIKLMKQ